MARLATVLLLLAALNAQAQQPEPTTPAARHFTDSKYGLTLQIPTAWNLSRRDSELSTFHEDARSAPPSSQLRAVAALSFNPYPLSDFAGALVYLSVTPHTNDADCARQSFLPLHRPATTAQINGISFSRGHDEHGGRFCVESRDDVYTTFRHNACYRVDLVVNTFCARTSGAQELTVRQMDDLQSREHKILESLTLKP